MLLREFIGVRAPSDLGEGGGGGGDGDLFARKDYAVPECLSFVIRIQKHLYSMKRKTVYYSHTE